MPPFPHDNPVTRTASLQARKESHSAGNNDEKVAPKETCCRMFTNKINRALEAGFAKIGYVVASNPWKVILLSLLISGLCCIGIIEKKDENRGEKNWVSQSSDPIKHKEWVDKIFPIAFRRSGLLVERKNKSNILTPEGLKKLYELNGLVRNIYNGTDRRQWDDICYSPSGNPSGCIPSSILELWSYDINSILNVTTKEIMDKVNQKNLRSPMTKRPINLNLFVGGIVRDVDGKILTASVFKMDYKIKKRDKFDKSKGLQVDKDADAWEEELENVFKADFNEYTVFSSSKWSNEKASNDATNGDLQFFVIGYIFVIVYLAVMLGSFSRINHKVYLAISGIAVIGLSIGISFGLGSAFQLKYTGVHNVLPFLLLGIGVDDIFVIVQNWDNVGGPKKDHRSIPDKVSTTLRHAGVSLLVTSVTDICAFAIGSSTILPALKSFSIWCAIGILAIFLLTITLFVALLALDAKRQESHRDACCCCIKLQENYEPMKCSEKKMLKGFMKNYYSPVILSIPGKVTVLLIVAGLLGAGGYGLSELEQNFDYNWFLPKTSRPRLYEEKDREAFPNSGFVGNVYVGEIDYYKGWKEMQKIKNKLDNDAGIAKGSANSWFNHYHTWLYKNYQQDLIPQNCSELECRAKNETEFKRLLNEFLQTEEGKNYIKLIIFNEQGNIRASKIPYKHVKLIKSTERIDAMDSIQAEIKPGLISDEKESLLPFAFSFQYISWETNKVISTELVRNLTLAGVCVLIVTLFLLTNIISSLMVLACVVFSLVDIAAFMGFWGLTIDTVTTIILVIAIGLTVDYSAHIAHAFLASRENDRNARVTAALTDVGPAVINGGISTFLAFAPLAASESYVFFTFFKVFFLVVLFGIFYGMVFLPVILSLIGPAPYADHTSKSGQTENANEASSGEPVQLKKVRNTNEETFVVVIEDGHQNIAYIPE